MFFVSLQEPALHRRGYILNTTLAVELHTTFPSRAATRMHCFKTISCIPAYNDLTRPSCARTRPSPWECRPVRSLHCGPPLTEVPTSRSPANDVVWCPEAGVRLIFHLPLDLVGVFWPRGTRFGCALWSDAAATARDICSCLNHERIRNCLRRQAAPPFHKWPPARVHIPQRVVLVVLTCTSTTNVSRPGWR